MSSSSFRQPTPTKIAQAQINTRAGTAPYLNPYPAGSLVTTPMDMGRFVASQLGTPFDGSAELMPEAARQLMLEQHFTPAATMPGSAYGYFESDANGHRSLHHTGDGGDHSLLYLVPDAKLGFFLVYTAPRQGDTSTPREQIAQDLIDHYLGCREPFAQPEPPPDFASGADRYVGTYRVEPYDHATIEKLAALGQEITITNPGDGTLGAELGDGAPIRLVESGPNLFRDPDGAYVAFRADTTGRITAPSFSGAAVDDPGSAERIGWFETANANLIFILLGASLVLVRVVAEVAVRLSGRRTARPAATIA